MADETYALWQCTAKRSHGPCNVLNAAEDEACGACGASPPVPSEPETIGRTLDGDWTDARAQALCECGHVHITVEQGGSWSVFHKCRKCECREFKPARYGVPPARPIPQPVVDAMRQAAVALGCDPDSIHIVPARDHLSIQQDKP